MVLAELDHPHIVRVLDVLEDGDGVAICMQLASGGSLEALLAERRRLDPGEVVAVAVPIAQALGSAHQRRVLHLDVKPANILFTSDGEPLLGDFGVARTLGWLTAVLGGGDAVAGTAHYIAPELLEGGTPDPRSDVYSLGVVCYEALTGVRPYDADLPLAVLRAAELGRYEPLTARPDVPPALGRAVDQAMARDPARRFPTAHVLALALHESLPAEVIRLPGTSAHASRFDADPADDPAPGTGPAVHPGTAPAPGTDSVPGGSGLGTDPADGPGSAPAAGGTGAAPVLGGGAGEARDTRTFGPRPPPPLVLPVPPPRRRLPIVPTVVAGLVGLAGVSVALVVWGPLGGEDGCPAVERPEVEVGVQVVSGDPEGDGCDAYGVYQLRVPAQNRRDMYLTIPVDGEERDVRVGEFGDRLLLGDWDCDGVDTPGLYWWSGGEVQYFDAWPETGDRLGEPDRVEPAPEGGRATVVAGSDGGAGDCDRISVRSAPEA
jgi:serine/threonine-protein kinase